MFPKETRFLVVDDMPSMRNIVKTALIDFGFKAIEEAGDGALALTRLNDALKEPRPFQVIICDWSMPNLTGLELLKICRSDANFKNIPFLLLTAEAESGNILDAIHAGVSGYLVKPFKPATLREKLEKISPTAG